MASIEGDNTVISTQTTDFGIKVEGYLNLCEVESKESGTNVYHGVIEITDERGGIVVPVQLLPVPNPDMDAKVGGHFELDDAARDYVTSKVALVFDAINKDEEGVTPAMKIRAVYMKAAAMEAPASSDIMSMLMDALAAAGLNDEDSEDDEDFDSSSLLRGLTQ